MVLVCRDAMLIAIMDVVTSLIAGFVIFTTFGGMAKKIGVEVKDVAKSGKIMLPTCICLRSSLQKNFEMAITLFIFLQAMDLLSWRIQKPCRNFRCPSFGPCCSSSCCLH